MNGTAPGFPGAVRFPLLVSAHLDVAVQPGEGQRRRTPLVARSRTAARQEEPHAVRLGRRTLAVVLHAHPSLHTERHLEGAADTRAPQAESA